jgi:hypothetical protein
MATLLELPGAIPPIPAMARILARFDRDSLSGFIEVAIGLIGTLESDADVEGNGDEGDCDRSEDDALDYSVYGNGPGCTVSDPDAEHDGKETDNGF